MRTYKVIGNRIPRVDALEKVTGNAKFCDDITLPGMLYGKILRSPHPHAKILSIDISKAKRIQGVKAIITAEDTLKVKYGENPRLADELPLKEKARCIGDEIAAVAALDEWTALEAIRLIEVDYEILPGVFHPEEAMKPGAPIIHEEISDNIALKPKLEAGNLGKGFQEADYIFEDQFIASSQQHCTLETYAAIARYQPGGPLILWTSTQTPYYLRSTLSNTLGIPVSGIRVIKPHVGGGFGSRIEMKVLDFCASLLSIKTGNPVKMVYTREEQFSTSPRRHPIIFEIKTGIKKDGRLTAKECKAMIDNGAYNNRGPVVAGVVNAMFVSLYGVPNVKSQVYLVYTNNQVGGAFRGFGSPQVNFAAESQMDMIAERIDMDPLELRLKNAVQSGDITPCGYKITSCGLRETIEEAAKRTLWKEKRVKGDGKGIGMASLIHVSSAKAHLPCDASCAQVKIEEDGSVFLFTGAVETGQGCETILAQMVAEELGIGMESVNLVTGDTFVVPLDLGNYASRTTFVAGNAVCIAAKRAKAELFSKASEKLETSAEDLVAEQGWIWVKGSPERKISFSDTVKAAFYEEGKVIIGQGHYNTSAQQPDFSTGYGNIASTYVFATQMAEIEVDRETGEIKVAKLTAAHDLGWAINPMSAEGQIEGALSQGLGYALKEEVHCKDGKLINPNFTDYKLINAFDMPPVECILVQTNDPEGPFGAKGLGEPGLVPTAAAIANAFYHATGIRMKELPITSEKVLRELKGWK